MAVGPREVRGRRLAGLLVVAVGVAGFVAPARKAVADTRKVRDAELLAVADLHLHLVKCVQEALRDVPHRPTFVLVGDEDADVQWYQRAVELGFGEVPFVADEADAEQVLQVVVNPDGDGVCGYLSVLVRPT